MKGPTPIMFVMFSAVAGRRPKRRSRGVSVAGVAGALMDELPMEGYAWRKK
jgi:hypothetical protein